MITLLTGKKGSGKTKRLIELAKAALKSSEGAVVVVEKGQKLTYDIPHAARLVNADDYSINSVDSLFGFISGICAGNYDVTDLFVDGTLKIVRADVDAIEELVTKFGKLTEAANTNITLSISAADEDIPEAFSDFIAKL